MKKDNLLYLEDILEAIHWILDEYLKDISFKEFTKDKKTQDAVIRQIAIIGEALNRISDEFLIDHPELPAPEAISMRNILIHNYDAVDINELWRTSKEDLPQLKKTIDNILKK